MARIITQLHPELQKIIPRLIEECAKNGLRIGIGECVRTVKEQDELYTQGRTKPGIIVTNARGISYSSMHQWGVAVDFFRNDGRGAYNESEDFFIKVGNIGKALGLEWGGDWKNPVDKPHFQLKQWGSTTARLKAMYGTPEKFFATWRTKPTKTVTNTSPKSDIMWLQENLNKALKSVPTHVPLKVDGSYGPMTIRAVLNVWRLWGWNLHGNDNGTKAGMKTINRLDV